MFATTTLQLITQVIRPMSPQERKALITLARAQTLPSSQDTILISKTIAVLPKLFTVFPPRTTYEETSLTDFGVEIDELITSPLTAGLVIVLCLELPDDYDTETIREASWTKEYLATQTRRREGEWNWDALVGNVDMETAEDSIIHRDFPRLSSLQKRFRKALPNFIQRIRGKRIFPHYTNRGISTETSEWILHRIKQKNIVKHGSTRTFMRDIDYSNLKSRDVVHFYIRTGVWPKGRVEMRQQWSPNLLVPRTYFAWGGNAISNSSYLRTLFNDIVDLFPPTHRYNRVQPDWLQVPTEDDQDGVDFVYYDLTSFTSWFSEQVPLLKALSTRFRDVMVDLVSEGLTLHQEDVSIMIDRYIENVNDFPEFYYKDPGLREECGHIFRQARHLCAGFLGVPGNLVTCTLGHGLAIAAVEGPEEDTLQVPGDDVGALAVDELHRQDIRMCAQTLGEIQKEKLYDGRQASVYLKRGVRRTGRQIHLTPMVIYPIPVLYLDSKEQYDHLKKTFRIPDRKDLVRRGAQILVTFIRDLWKISKGKMEDKTVEVIYDYLSYLHSKLRLPLGGVLQGNILSGEGFEDGTHESIAVKFPLDRDFLREDPDFLFADRYINVFTIRDVSRVSVLWEIDEGLRKGDVHVVRSGRKWSFLRDMGYIRQVDKVGGEKVVLIGSDAKQAYLNSKKPPYTCIEVIEDLSLDQLSSVGFKGDAFGVGSIVFDDNATSQRRVEEEFRRPIRKYRDWDRPSYGGIEVDYGDGAAPVTLMQFGNDSMDLLDLY